MATNVIQNSESKTSRTAGLKTGDLLGEGLQTLGRPVAQPSAAVSANITPEQIRQRAYELYVARQGGSGDAESDWCQAERELRATAMSRFGNARDLPAGAGFQAASGIAGRSAPRLFSGG